MHSLFGQLLIGRSIINQAQLDEAIHKQQTSMGHRKIGEILVRMGVISKSHIIEVLADQLGVPIVKISDREIPERICSLMPGYIATIYRIIPIEEKDGLLVVASADPANFDNIKGVQRLLERPIETVIATPEEIALALKKYYGLTG